MEEEIICETDREILYVEEIVREIDCKYPVNMPGKTVVKEENNEEWLY